jgi:hypothetical protein
MSTSDSAELQTKAALFASTALLALVTPAGGTEAQITPDEIPESVTREMLPAISYERSGSQPEHTLESELAASKVQIDVTVWATSRSSANQVAAAVSAAMHEAGHTESDRDSDVDAELRLHAAIVTFDVWELHDL